MQGVSTPPPPPPPGMTGQLSSTTGILQKRKKHCTPSLKKILDVHPFLIRKILDPPLTGMLTLSCRGANLRILVSLRSVESSVMSETNY